MPIRRLRASRVLLVVGLIAAAGRAQTCAWAPLAGSLGGINARVDVLQACDLGSGPELYVAGQFSSVDGVPATNIARWNGMAWSPVGAGLIGSIADLEAHDDGSGPALYAVGQIQLVPGGPLLGVARFAGGSWAPVGSGFLPPGNALAVFDDGSGPLLYASRGDSSPPLDVLSRWDGTTWQPVNPVFGPNQLAAGFAVLVPWHDGSGPALYAAGVSVVLAPGPGVSGFGRFDGTSWTWLPGNGSFLAEEMVLFDDGGGPALYACGSGGGGIARFDGTAWSPLGTGADPILVPNGPLGQPILFYPAVLAMAVFDDGSGPALFAAGEFMSMSGVAAPGMAKWDGVGWSPAVYGSSVHALGLGVFDDGGGPDLFAGSFGSSTFGVGAAGLARLACASNPVSVLASQAAPGSPLWLSNANLTPGREYLNVISLDPCPDGPGTGSPALLGLCFASPASIAFLTTQLALPVSSPPFHFVATESAPIWGPFALPPITADAICLELQGGGILSWSTVTRITSL